MLRTSRFALLAILFAGAISGRMLGSESYGSAGEMKGVTRIFIDTAGEMDLRAVIAGVMAKRLPEASIVEDSTEAELTLTFRYHRDSHHPDAFYGTLIAKKITDEGAIRYLASYRHDESELDDLASEVTLRFVKDFKQTNGPARK